MQQGGTYGEEMDSAVEKVSDGWGDEDCGNEDDKLVEDLILEVQKAHEEH